MKMDWVRFWEKTLVVGGILASILKFICIPISWLLALLLWVFLIITTPLQWTAKVLYHFMNLPIRFLARFETLFYYFGTACVIGIVSGLVLYYSTSILFRLLSIQDRSRPRHESEPEPKATRGRTLASYRAERAQRQAEQAWKQLRLHDLPLPSDSELKSDNKGWSPGGGLARYPLSPAVEKKGLLSTTIFEEEDSSDYTTI